MLLPSNVHTNLQRYLPFISSSAGSTQKISNKSWHNHQHKYRCSLKADQAVATPESVLSLEEEHTQALKTGVMSPCQHVQDCV